NGGSNKHRCQHRLEGGHRAVFHFQGPETLDHARQDHHGKERDEFGGRQIEKIGGHNAADQHYDHEAQHESGARNLKQMIIIENPPHSPADQQQRNEDQDSGQALQLAKRQSDQGRRERSKAVQADYIAKDAYHQSSDGKEQQELD